jgi:CRISPR-associated endonuclease/helicase Cas3
LAVLPSRFSPVRLLGLAEKVIVIDEAHAYDAYVTEELLALLRFHRGVGGSAVILSATLTNNQREALSRCWQGTVNFGTPEGWIPDETRYPLATVVGPSAMAATEIAPALWSRRQTPVTLVDTPEAVLDGLAATLAAGGCATWVRNTVDDVHAAAGIARGRGLDPIIFHARFAQCDRQAIEAQIMARFGPHATQTERAGQLVIATQVIEQSLDIDFDQLASDLAPIDLLLQRVGRMRRHSGRQRPDGLGDVMLVLSPQPVEDASANWLKSRLPGTAAVYRDHGVLWRTAREIKRRGAFAVPDDVRALVEVVHGGSDCPDALLASSDAAYGKDRVDTTLAGHQLLKFDDGYMPGNKWESDLSIATRNIEASATIRLARRDRGGQIVPWAFGTVGNWPDWQAWALSEVRLSGGLAKAKLKNLAELEGELAPVIARWGRFERELPVCVLQQVDGSWEGRISNSQGVENHISYNKNSGLSVLKK